MFAVGERVLVGVENWGVGTIARDEGGDDYLVELDKKDADTGRPKRIGVQGRFLKRESEPMPPVAGMVKKGMPSGVPAGGDGDAALGDVGDGQPEPAVPTEAETEAGDWDEGVTGSGETEEQTPA